MQDLKKNIKILKAISNEGRLRILSLLHKKKGLCVCEIKELIGLSQSTISSHLRKLGDCGLITYSKEGKWINYSLDPELDSNIKKLLEDIIAAIRNNSQIKKDYSRLNEVKRENICNINTFSSKNPSEL